MTLWSNRKEGGSSIRKWCENFKTTAFPSAPPPARVKVSTATVLEHASGRNADMTKPQAFTALSVPCQPRVAGRALASPLGLAPELFRLGRKALGR